MPEKDTIQETADFRADMGSMKSDMTDLKNTVKQIADAVTKLAVLEDRQSNQTLLIEKALGRLEVLEEKQHVMELRMATSAMTNDRLMGMERQLNEVAQRQAGYEMAGKTAAMGVRTVWAVLGSAITAGVAWLIGGGYKTVTV